MTSTDIENLSFAEIKEQRDSLVDEASKAPTDELARKYVRARMDAVQRDEKLAEQGKTITALQQALDQQGQKIEATDGECRRLQGITAELTAKLNAQADEHASELGTVHEQHAMQVDKATARITELSTALKTETARAARLKQLLDRVAPGLGTIHAQAAQLVTSLTTEAANEGE